jgi:hypothetical protein
VVDLWNPKYALIALRRLEGRQPEWGGRGENFLRAQNEATAAGRVAAAQVARRPGDEGGPAAGNGGGEGLK